MEAQIIILEEFSIVNLNTIAHVHAISSLLYVAFCIIYSIKEKIYPNQQINEDATFCYKPTRAA